jgi:hypothetical protein
MTTNPTDVSQLNQQFIEIFLVKDEAKVRQMFDDVLTSLAPNIQFTVQELLDLHSVFPDVWKVGTKGEIAGEVCAAIMVDKIADVNRSRAGSGKQYGNSYSSKGYPSFA